jgi:hypothetical protein
MPVSEAHWSCRRHHALHHARADTELPADLEDAISVRPQLQYSRLDGGLDPPAAQLRAIRLCAGEPGIDPLPNDTPLELCESPQHLKHRFASSR